MTPPPSIQLIPDAEPKIDHAAFDRAFRAWGRRRACPDELARLDRRDQADRERQGRVNKGRSRR